MRRLAIAASLVATAAGCGSSARSTGASNASGPTGENQVVLVAAGAGVGLLGCWDAKTGRVVDDASCVAAMTDAPTLAVADGATVQAGAKTDVVFCEIGEDPPMTVPGFALDAERVEAGEAPAIAVYPATAKVALATWNGDQDFAMTDAQRAAAIKALLTAVPGLVDTDARGAGTFDLDGDGKVDTLIFASGTTPSDDLGTSHEALYADFGDGAMVELFKETGTPAGGVRINATLDLGSDGRTELFVSGWWNGGGRDQLVSVGRDRVVTAVGKIGCDS